MRIEGSSKRGASQYGFVFVGLSAPHSIVNLRPELHSFHIIGSHLPFAFNLKHAAF